MVMVAVLVFAALATDAASVADEIKALKEAAIIWRGSESFAPRRSARRYLIAMSPRTGA